MNLLQLEQQQIGCVRRFLAGPLARTLVRTFARLALRRHRLSPTCDLRTSWPFSGVLSDARLNESPRRFVPAGLRALAGPATRQQRQGQSQPGQAERELQRMTRNRFAQWLKCR